MTQRDENRLTLMSFVNFCAANPDLRFWQALAAWSGKQVWAGNFSELHWIPKGSTEWTAEGFEQRGTIEDTFNWTGRHK